MKYTFSYIQTSLIIAVFLFIFLNGKSQTTVIDSLKAKLEVCEADEKVNILLSIANQLSEYDLQASLKYSYEALQMAQTINSKKLLAKCYLYLGYYTMETGNIDESLDYFYKTLDFFRTFKIDCDLCILYNSIGNAYSKKGILDSALYFHQAAYARSVETKDTMNQIISQKSIGNAYYKKGEFDRALSQFRSGLSLANYFKKAIKEESDLMNNLGILYSDWGEYDASLSYYRKALDIMDSLGNHSGIGRIYNNMGNIYWYEEAYDSALIFYNKSFEKREEIGDENGKAYVLNNLGMIYGSLGDFEKSIEYFKHSFNLFEKINNRRGVVIAIYNIAFVYIEIEDFENAKKYLNQSLIIAQEQGFNDYITASLEILSQLYEKTDDWENAFNTLGKFKSVNDSIRNQRNMDIIKELEIKYENEKYKADLSILESQVELEKSKRNQNLIILLGVFIVIILIILSTYLLISKMKLSTTNQYNRLTPSLLRYQLNPEFINSSLSGIKELVSKNRIKESGLFLSGFAKLLRTFIETSSNNAIVLDRELTTIQQFVNLHQLRYEHEIIFDLKIDENIETEMIAIPPLVIFPVFVHLIEYYLNSGKIDIYLDIDLVKSKLQFNAALAYIARKSDEKTDKNDLRTNIASIKDRIKSINKLYKEDIEFNYSTEHKGEKTILNIKLLFPVKPV